MTFLRTVVPLYRVDLSMISSNVRKNAVIGLGALFAFLLLELMVAVAAGVVVFLDVVLDVDLPFIPDSRE